MSNVIQFLEALGGRPALSSAEYVAAVAALDVDERQQAALAGRDQMSLSRLLDGRARMLCAICAPDDDEQEAVPDDEDGDHVPDHDDPQSPQK